eukprot:SAG11_NODE_6951_length_1220_cov_2.016949_1_plen_106_part_00
MTTATQREYRNWARTQYVNHDIKREALCSPVSEEVDKEYESGCIPYDVYQILGSSDCLVVAPPFMSCCVSHTLPHTFHALIRSFTHSHVRTFTSFTYSLTHQVRC